MEHSQAPFVPPRKPVGLSLCIQGELSIIHTEKGPMNENDLIFVYLLGFGFRVHDFFSRVILICSAVKLENNPCSLVKRKIIKRNNLHCTGTNRK